MGLDHSWVGDLVIKLVAPDGTTTTTLVNRMGGALNSGNNFCQTTLDDASAGAVIDTLGAASNPFTGSFKPSAPLSTFVGTNGNGTWKLQANDWEPTDTGSIRAWSLDIRPVACAAASNPTAITATKTVAGSFVPGGTVDYKVTLTNTGTGTQVDNPGDEFTDTLPPQLTFVSASASSGSISVAGSTVKWNGSIPGGGERDDPDHGQGQFGDDRPHGVEPGNGEFRPESLRHQQQQRPDRRSGGRRRGEPDAVRRRRGVRACRGRSSPRPATTRIRAR